jgi:hypothetical protein
MLMEVGDLNMMKFAYMSVSGVYTFFMAKSRTIPPFSYTGSVVGKML